MSFTSALNQRSRQWASVVQFLKYCVTGVVNTILSYAVYALLVHETDYPSLSLAIGYVAGMVTSYVINAGWTFQGKIVHWVYIWRFVLVNLVILIISEGSLWTILRFVVSSKYLAQGLNTGLIVFLGFLLNRLLVFSQKPSGS